MCDDSLQLYSILSHIEHKHPAVHVRGWLTAKDLITVSLGGRKCDALIRGHVWLSVSVAEGEGLHELGLLPPAPCVFCLGELL